MALEMVDLTSSRPVLTELSSRDRLLPTGTWYTTGGAGFGGAVTSIFRRGSLVCVATVVEGGGGEGVTRLEFDRGGGMRVGIWSLVVGGATCIGGVVLRAAPEVPFGVSVISVAVSAAALSPLPVDGAFCAALCFLDACERRGK